MASAPDGDAGRAPEAGDLHGAARLLGTWVLSAAAAMPPRAPRSQHALALPRPPRSPAAPLVPVGPPGQRRAVVRRAIR